jgi:flagellin-like protein
MRKARRHFSRRRGVSEVVATILLLGLTVTLFAMLFFFVTKFPIAPQAQALTEFQASLQLTANGTYISGVTIVPVAGPSVPGYDTVWFKGAGSSSNPSFLTPMTVASGIGGNSSWGLGQAWVYSFANPRPQLQNVTIYVASPSQLLFSATLPGQSFNLPLMVSRAWANPAAPLVGAPFTVYAVFGGSNVTFGLGQPTVNLALLPGGPSSAQAMTAVGPSAPGEYEFTCSSWNLCITSAPGAYTIFVNGVNTGGSQATGVVSITLNPNYARSANFTVTVLITPSQPTPGTTITPSAVVTYLATQILASPLTVEFWANQTTPSHTAYGPWFGAGQVITGPSTMTVTSTQTWTLPSTPGGYTIAASATAGSPANQSASATLFFSTVGLKVSPSQDPRGTSMNVTGTGFTPSAAASVQMSSVGTLTPISCTGGATFSGTTITTNPSGGFTCRFTVPGGAAIVPDTLTGTDFTSGGLGTTTFTVTNPSIYTSPSQGPKGLGYAVYGSGFTISSSATVKVGSSPLIAGCTVATSGSGSFSCAFSVLGNMTVGATTITATDATTGITAGTSFTRTTPTLSIPTGPTAGPIASDFEVSGAGFSPGSITSMSLGGTALTPISCTVTFLVTVIYLSGSGTYTCLFQVPGFAGVGADPLSGTDTTGTNPASIVFTGTVEAITEFPTATAGAPHGTAIWINGTGFTETTGFSNGLVTISLNGVTLSPTCPTGVGTAGGGGLDTSVGGAFQSKVTIPGTLTAGTYLLSVSDLTSGQTLNVLYTVT